MKEREIEIREFEILTGQLPILERQTDKQTDRQTDRQKDRDRQADRDRHAERQKESCFETHTRKHMKLD